MKLFPSRKLEEDLFVLLLAFKTPHKVCAISSFRIKITPQYICTHYGLVFSIII